MSLNKIAEGRRVFDIEIEALKKTRDSLDDTFVHGIKLTIDWYLNNREWWETIISGEYQNYYEKMYGNR